MVSIPSETVVVPLADEDDAAATCRALEPRLDPGDRIVLVYVVEKAGGAPDKASVEQREDVAETLFEIGRRHLEDGSRTVDTRVLYGTDVAETIVAAADDVDADLIVFSPREASRLARFLSGDTTLDLVTGSDRPVLVLPGADDDGADDDGAD